MPCPLDFDLPLTVRLGAQIQPRPDLSVEAGVDFEAWSMQKDISIDPHGIQVTGVPGVGSYQLNLDLDRARDLSNTIAAHVGAEWNVLPGMLIARAGYLLETSATPDRTASVLAPDGFPQPAHGRRGCADR